MCDACNKWTGSLKRSGGMLIMPLPNEVDPIALARFHKAQRIGDDVAKLRPLLPTWLRAHIAASAMPKPFVPDLTWHIAGCTAAQMAAFVKAGLGKPYKADFEPEVAL